MERMFALTRDELTVSPCLGPAFDEVTAITHCGTHVDAPWHYSPTSGGAPAKRIDECPLEWFFGDGVVRNLRHKRPGERIQSMTSTGRSRRSAIAWRRSRSSLPSWREAVPLAASQLAPGCDSQDAKSI